MTALDDATLAAIAERAEAATPGPWRWGGNVDYHEVYLSTVDRGRIFIMRFVRWGMRGAQPQFQPTSEDEWGLIPAADMVVRERDYRGDIATIDHPDAAFIAHARTDIPLLLAEVARLRRELEDCDPPGDGR